MFGGFSAFAVIFIYFFFRESKDLTDSEKKELYAPKDKAEKEKTEGDE